MPVIINEILIRSTIEKSDVKQGASQATAKSDLASEEIIKQAVEKMLEILEEKKLR